LKDDILCQVTQAPDHSQDKKHTGIDAEGNSGITFLDLVQGRTANRGSFCIKESSMMICESFLYKKIFLTSCVIVISFLCVRNFCIREGNYSV